MKIKFVVLSFITLIISNLSAQKYITKDGVIKFHSHTPLEEIKAENRKVACSVDSKTGDMQIQLLMKGFDFPNNLMEEHFNESYAESSKFPKATFIGKISDIASVEFDKDGEYTVNYSGKMTIKDVTKDVKGQCVFKVSKGKVNAVSSMKIKPKDYNFKIPGAVEGKIAEELDVDVSMDLAK